MTKYTSRSPLPVFKFAVPMILMGLSQTLMSSIDYIFTSGLGAEVSAAIAPASTIAFVPISFWLGLMSVYSALPAEALMTKNHKKVSSYFISGLAIAFLSIPVALGLSYFSPDLINFIGHAESIRPFETQYLSALALTVPGAAVAFLCQNFFTLSGDTKTPSVVVISGHILNAVLNYFLINGVFFKPLGLYGAALATVIATFYQAFLMLWILLIRKKIVSFKDFPAFEEVRGVFKETIKVSLPSGLQWMQSSLVWMLFTNVIIGQLAVVQMASHNILSQVAKLATLPIIGLANASTSLLAQSVGLSDYQSFFKVSEHMRNISVFLIASTSAILLLFSDKIFKILTLDAEVIAFSKEMLPILLLYIWASSFETLSSTKLRAHNDTISSAAVTTVSLWIILIAGSYFGLSAWPELGAKAPWLFTIMSSLFTMACLRYRFSSSHMARIPSLR